MTLPAVSVIFLAYRQQDYIVSALRSILSQDLASYEVVIGDDASPDSTRSLIEAEVAAHRGVAKIVLLPHGHNLGVIGNFNRCVAASTGEILVVAAGDDISYPSRLRRVASFFASHPDVFAHYSNARIIDGRGATIRSAWSAQDRLEIRRFAPGSHHLYQYVRFCGATGSYRRKLFETFGPMHLVRGGEDGPLLLRAIMLGAAAVDPEVLVDWRWHGANMSHGGKPTSLGWHARLERCAAWPAGQMEHLDGYLADIRHAESRNLAPAVLTATLRRLALEHHALASLRRDSVHPDASWREALSSARKYWQASPRASHAKARQIAKALFKKCLPARLRAAVLARVSRF
jgi:hypothetical protein